ncbi:DNA polymerase lambda [Fistulifera solaris]|uniref:DNA polymerase lambda n=1 Tax=Fistulifera solaris TaxID=1519565 RepID=A0A1Z5KNN2_FISSO|nr:DNA polymerase lambda [Fistulifera solaris]|eukprot:GAX27621.1 DNA polymerase lambda [Fistulifera solaris]
MTELWVKKDAHHPRSLILIGAKNEGCVDYKPIDSIISSSKEIEGSSWLGPVDLRNYSHLKLCPPQNKGDVLEFAICQDPDAAETSDFDQTGGAISTSGKDAVTHPIKEEHETHPEKQYRSRGSTKRATEKRDLEPTDQLHERESIKTSLQPEHQGRVHHDLHEAQTPSKIVTPNSKDPEHCESLEKKEKLVQKSLDGFASIGSDQSKKRAATEPQLTTPFRIYFVREGMDMIDELIESGDGNGLKNHVIQRNAIVLDHFDKTNPPFPTHIVVSDNGIKPERLATALGFNKVEDLEDFVDDNNIVCVHRKWAAKGNAFSKPPLRSPALHERYINLHPKANRDSMSGQEMRRLRRKCEAQSPDKRNQELADHFRKLSKLYQTAPIHDTDDWRAYSFSLTAGRLRLLDFEVTEDPDELERLSKTKGFGATTMSIIREFLQTGTSSRIKELEHDENRVIMRRMMNIWGVGRAKATELVRAGYRSIDEVKAAVEAGAVTVDRSQYIGLLCYEDIMEEMSRSEVEAIFDIVKKCFKEDYPQVQMQINGSYRRGKETCGDIDILVTHASYYDTVPPNAVGVVADKLLARGFIEHHLTYISGMNPELFNRTIPPDVRRNLIEHRGSSSGKRKADKSSSTTYFGVIRSPMVLGRRRRLDIKFYPYRERVFASIYFTGNGYFNRAMRLWSQQKLGWTLNDHGLFIENTEVSILENPTNEKEVFDKLGLVWKEVTERDSFAAVQAKEGNENAIQLRELSRSALREEEMNYQWVD